jgi:2-dehydro-3-deoxyphosphogluconate aldolase / (4S)-4-hydroxy-2-oxoglutarate aldolase
MNRQFNIRKILTDNPLIPVVTFDNINDIDSVVNHLIKSNINCIEITLRTAISFEALEYVKSNFRNDLSVGVGTVVNSKQVSRCVDIGVDFIISPGITEKLISSFNESKIPYLPGVSSVNDILNASELGCDTLKFFPAELSGGIKMLKHYNSIFPSIKFCPTGGIGLSNYNSYLELENVISVGGSWLVK